MKRKIMITIFVALFVCMMMASVAHAATHDLVDGEVFDLSSTISNDIVNIPNAATVTLTGTAPDNVEVVCGENSKVTLKDAELNCTANNKRSMTYNHVGTDFTITLVGTNHISSRYFPGIGVLGGRATFDGTGSLTVFSGGGSAAIGGERNTGMGEIVINSGDITARGGQNGSGIGGGMDGSLNNITINGGTISARGGDAAAGIGNGKGTNIAGAIITINGGTVTAQGGSGGAGIGGGYEGRNGSIVIAGGKVYATGGMYAAGIGGGGLGDFYTGVFLNGGEIYACAGDEFFPTADGCTAQDIGHGDEGTEGGERLILPNGSLIFLEKESAGIYSLMAPTPEYTTFNSSSDVPSRYNVPATWTYPIGAYGTVVYDLVPTPAEHTPEKVQNPETGDFTKGSNNAIIILLIGLVVVLGVIGKNVVKVNHL